MPRECALCGRPAGRLLVAGRDLRVSECRPCRLAFLESFPDNPLVYYEKPDYYDAWWGSDRAGAERHVRQVKELTHRWVIRHLRRRLAPGARVLEIGCAYGYFLRSLLDAGYAAEGVECSAAAGEAARAGLTVHERPFDGDGFAEGSFDAVVLLDVFEHLRDPLGALAAIRRILVPGGSVAMLTPDYRSGSSRLLGRRWMHYKEEHLYYFSRSSLAAALERSGFQRIEIRRAMKGTSLSYMGACSQRYGNAPGFLNAALRSAPLSRRAWMTPSGLLALASRPA